MTDASRDNAFTYPPSSPEETAFRRALEGAILEFGEPHSFELGAMTRPLLSQREGTANIKAGGALEYYMLQEDGVGCSIFAALRMTYVEATPAEPVRLAVQFVTTRGTAVIDVAVPSRYAEDDQARNRSYEEKLGPHVRIGVLSRTKGVRLGDILDAFAANKNAPTKELAPLLTVMREQGEATSEVSLSPESLKLLTSFIIAYFGDYSAKAPAGESALSFEEIIPETPEEVSKSDHWITGIAQAAEDERAFEEHKKPKDLS